MEELATRHLFQRRCVEHVIHALHGILQCALVPHVANVELDFMGYFGHPDLEVVPHVILLLFVAREDADLTDVRPQETVQHRIPETTCPARDQQGLVFEDCHINWINEFTNIQKIRQLPTINIAVGCPYSSAGPRTGRTGIKLLREPGSW